MLLLEERNKKSSLSLLSILSKLSSCCCGFYSLQTSTLSSYSNWFSVGVFFSLWRNVRDGSKNTQSRGYMGFGHTTERTATNPHLITRKHHSVSDYWNERKKKRGRSKKRAGFYAVVKITETSTQHAYRQTLLLFKSLNIFKSQPIVRRRYPTGSRPYYYKQIPSRMTSVASSSFIIIRRSVNFHFCYCRCREKEAEPKIISNRPFVEALICLGANPTRFPLIASSYRPSSKMIVSNTSKSYE